MTERVRYFKEYLRHVSVSMALWRCFECEEFAREKLAGPVLDVGCGDGFFAKTVLGGPLEAGIDLDPREVERAVRSGAYRRAVVGSATAMPFRKGEFRTVVSNCVPEHIPDIDGALREAARVLRTGGRLIITVPSEAYNQRMGLKVLLESVGLGFLGRAYLAGMNRIFKHFHVDDAATWRARLRRAGFTVEVCKYIIPMPAFRAYEAWLPPAFISKINRVLFGRWVLLPRGWVAALAPLLLKRALESQGDPGAGYYIRARKTR
jgi:SAM-dependent methyltransferase